MTWLLLGVLGLYVLLDVYFSFTNRYLTGVIPRLRLCGPFGAASVLWAGIPAGIFQFARVKFD